MARPQRMETDSMAILSITGWTSSKASNDPDGGASALEGWLKRKAQRPIQASQRQGDVFQIQVLEKDKRSFLHVDGWRWAGVDVKVSEGQLDSAPRGPPRNAPPGPRGGGFGGGQRNDQRNGSLESRMSTGPQNSFNNQTRNSSRELFGNPPSGPRGGGFQQNRQPNGQSSNSPFGGQRQNGSEESQQEQQTRAVLEQIIRKRYNAAERFLDFSALPADTDIQASGLVSSDANKVFSALFRVCENNVFETKDKRAEMIQSVSFKGNALSTVKDIIGAASTFYRIKNLDLSDNNFKVIKDLSWWKNRFPQLEQIILAGNPVDSPQTKEEVRRWYKNLKTYNMQPLDAPFVGSLQPQLEITPPVPTSSPAPGAILNGALLSPEQHPEFPAGSTFGLPEAGKPDDLVLKEQLGLKFSYETGLKMKWVEECLVSNNFDYEKAKNDLEFAMQNGNVPSDAFIQGV